VPNASEKVLDLFVGHDVDLERLFAGVRKETLASIERLSRELTDLVYRIDPTEPTRLLYRQKRLAKLVKESVSTISQAYGEMRGASRKQLASLAKLEAGASRVLVNEAVGMELATVALSSEQIRALTSNVLIEGSTIKEAWKTAEASTAKRFASSMRTGMRNGETINQLAKRLRERAFVTTNKHHAITLARTGFQEVSQAARQDLFEANTDVIKAIQQISTLDGRTSPICQAYSGATWSLPDYNALDGSPPYNGGPPRHFRCRSSLVPVTRSWRELSSKPRLPGGSGTPSQSLENRFKAGLKKRGFTDKQIAKQKMGQRASMDGQVAGDTTYEKWLKGKSAAQRREILGPGKAQLWEDGKLTNLRDLVDQSGRPLTISELEARLGAVKPKPKPRPRPKPKPTPQVEARTWGDTTPLEAEWHDKAFGPDVPDKLGRVIEKMPPVRVHQSTQRRSYYQPALDPSLSEVVLERGAELRTWRHEYGHAVDFVNGGGDFKAASWAKHPALLADRAPLVKAVRLRRKQLSALPRGEWPAFMHGRADELAAAGDDAIEEVLRRFGLSASDLPAELSRADRAVVASGFEKLDLEQVSKVVNWNNPGSFDREMPGVFGDFLGAITNNKVGSGHSTHYYTRTFKGTQRARGITTQNTTEAFAEYWAMMGAPAHERKLWRAVMERFAPETTRGFDELIEAILAGA